ncbi:MAG: glycosyltransferase family 2 protein [Mesorhizobium sp.]|nr:glycosyltransferase family 2 protein [Mesorhizobium sp.]
MQRKVAVLVGVYNGDRYLSEQLASLADQQFPNIDVWISDDGSIDDSIEKIQEAKLKWVKGRFEILAGPGEGFAENFRSLLVNEQIDGDYFAFCDQDDIWSPPKLSTAIDWLSGQPESTPALYCTRTRIVDDEGRHVGYSPRFLRPTSFRNAMVQSIAGGNTMVLNRSARELVAEASRRSGFVSHDWWCYLIVTGAGGVVRYAAEPQIDYRQHAGNLVGANGSIVSRLGRSSFLFRGGFAAWMERNISGLQACEDLLTPDARLVLGQVARLRGKPLPQRLWGLYRSGVYRQTLSGQIGLFLACALNRF